MNRILKVIIGGVVTGVLGYALILHSPQIRQNVAVRDSIAYWVAGRLLIDHQNPYDYAAALRLEQEQGYKDQRPLVLRTPPWSLFLVAPLGFLVPFWAWVAWIAVSLGCLLTGVRLSMTLYGGGKIPPNLFTIVGYTFAPVPACLVSGQMGLVLMLGVVLFLWWEPKRPLLAGAALVMPFAKPHLLSLFWVVFILWIVLRRKREVAVGFLAALTFAITFAVVLDPQVFQHYREMLHTASIGNEFIPALSGVLRLLFFRRMFWVQFIPVAIGLIWAVRFFAQNASSWDWRQHGPALLVVSVLTTPYEWLSDETVLLPAILQAAAFAYIARGKMRVRTKIALVVFALLDALLLLILKSKVPFSTGIYFWSSLVWFFWYFRARNWYSQASASQQEIEPASRCS
jgi:Glycosyltransferase family 87